MCGEKGDLVPIYLDEVGSPPHVRGKGNAYDTDKRKYGITPACAGKRVVCPCFLIAKGDHPRMCGEKTKKIP